MENNGGSFICLQCSRHLKSSGSHNPNSKYHFDHEMFKSIDTEEKAYLLGWIASDGHISKSSWSIKIEIQDTDIRCLETLKDIVCEEIPIVHIKNNIRIEIHSKTMCLDICKLLSIKRGKKSNTVNFPNLNNQELTWAFQV